MNMQEIALPPGIEKHLDTRTNRYYFVDHNNKSTSWIDPRTNTYYDPRNPPMINNQNQKAHINKPPVQNIQINQAQQCEDKKEETDTKPNGANCQKISEIDEIRNKVNALGEKIKIFPGCDKKNRDYLELEDELEKLLIQLDGVQADGKQEVRDARKHVVKEIQAQLSMLEFKVDTNAVPNNYTNDTSHQPKNPNAT